MAEKRFEVDLPDEVLAGFRWQEEEMPSKLREALIIELLRLDRLSEPQAAELFNLALHFPILRRLYTCSLSSGSHGPPFIAA